MCGVINGLPILCSVDHKQERINELEHALKELEEKTTKAISEKTLGHPMVEAGAMEDLEMALESARRVLP